MSPLEARAENIAAICRANGYSAEPMDCGVSVAIAAKRDGKSHVVRAKVGEEDDDHIARSLIRALEECYT